MIESDQTIHFEDDTGISQGPREIVLKELLGFISVSIASSPISSPIVDQHPVATPDNELIEDVDPVAPDVVMDIPLRRSKRACRPLISDDYIVYLQGHDMWVMYQIRLSTKKTFLVLNPTSGLMQ